MHKLTSDETSCQFNLAQELKCISLSENGTRKTKQE